jgi:rare lipoprotein A
MAAPVTHPVALPAVPAETSPTPVSPGTAAPTAPVTVADDTGGESTDQGAQIGMAEYLSDQMEGRQTASGERFNGAFLCAAHRKLPLGTRVRVTNLENHRSVVVRVNDRGAFRRGVIISVTRSAAEQLGFGRAGSARVSIAVVR